MKIVRTVYSILDVFGFYLLNIFRCNNHWMHMNLYQLYLLYSWFILQGKLSFYFLNYCIVILHMHVEFFNLKVNNRFGLLKHIFATWILRISYFLLISVSDICFNLGTAMALSWGSTIGLVGCGVWLFFVVILGVRAENRSGMQEF